MKIAFLEAFAKTSFAADCRALVEPVKKHMAEVKVAQEEAARIQGSRPQDIARSRAAGMRDKAASLLAQADAIEADLPALEEDVSVPEFKSTRTQAAAPAPQLGQPK